jgi:hypothetical protein
MDVANFHDIFSSWHYAFYYFPSKNNTLLSHVQLVVNSQFIISTFYLMDQMTLQYPTTLKRYKFSLV